MLVGDSGLSIRERHKLWRQGARSIRHGWIPCDDLDAELGECGVRVVPYEVDVSRFIDFVKAAGYYDRAYYDRGRARAAREKWLEHFVSIDLLRPRREEVFIDVASAASPFADILQAVYGCHSGRLDWSFPQGHYPNAVLGDVGRLPFRTESVDGFTLHCSYEHFEEERDRDFLREADRVLRFGGRLCILPLYLSRVYGIQTDLKAWRLRAPTFDPAATVSIADGWGEVHGRFYDRQQLADRVLGSLNRLAIRVYRLSNTEEVGQDCYLKYAAVFTKS